MATNNNTTETSAKILFLMGFFGLLFALLYSINKQFAMYGLALVFIGLLINRGDEFMRLANTITN